MNPLRLAGVSATAVLTLRARAEENDRVDRLFSDERAALWFAEVEWPQALDRWYNARVQGFLAYRAHEIDRIVEDWASDCGPNRLEVVELGSGLSSRYARIGAQHGVRFVDVDLPSVIDVRRQLDQGASAHRLIARSVLDLEWLEEVDPSPELQSLFVAEGLFYYLPEPEVLRVVRAIEHRFPRAGLVFDVIGAFEHRGMLARSTAVGAPIQWMAPPPFEGVFPRFGLVPMPKWGPDELLKSALERCWKRFGPVSYWAARQAARVPALRALRSGLVAAVFPSSVYPVSDSPGPESVSSASDASGPESVSSPSDSPGPESVSSPCDPPTPGSPASASLAPASPDSLVA